jgi:hypothetical protein
VQRFVSRRSRDGFFRAPESVHFFDTWRVVDRVGMGERHRPQALTPFYRELLRQLLARVPEPVGASLAVDELQVAEFVKEHVIEHKSANGERRPFPPWDCTKLFRRLAHSKRSRQAHARGQSTECDFTPASIDVTVQAGTPAAVVEMHRAKSRPQLRRQTAKDNTHILLADVMDSVSTGDRYSELNAMKHFGTQAG